MVLFVSLELEVNHIRSRFFHPEKDWSLRGKHSLSTVMQSSLNSSHDIKLGCFIDVCRIHWPVFSLYNGYFSGSH